MLKETLKKLGIRDITISDENKYQRITGMYDRCKVTGTWNPETDKLDLVVSDLTRDKMRELSRCGFHKRIADINAKSIRNFKRRVRELITRKYTDRNKLLTAKQLEIGKEYFIVMSYGEGQNIFSFVVPEGFTVPAEGAYEVPVVARRMHKFFSEFDDTSDDFAKDLENVYINEEDLFTVIPSTMDGNWDIHELDLDEFVPVEKFLTYYRYQEALHAAVDRILNEQYALGGDDYDSYNINCMGVNDIAHIFKRIRPELEAHEAVVKAEEFVKIRGQLQEEYQLNPAEDWYKISKSCCE